MDDNLWIIELESALLDDCSVNEIYAICEGKTIPDSLRPDLWQLALDVRNKPNQMQAFNEIYDLPNQSQLHQDCQKFVEKLGNDDDDDKLAICADLESIITFYCKNRNLKYEPNNGWIELLIPLLPLKLRRSDNYNLFESIRDTYIPNGCVKKGNVFHVLRLLILYHDPQLCAILDTKRITPDLYSMSWFQSLFAATCVQSVVAQMWDLYFLGTDPFLVFFLSLTMLINGRDQIMAMKDEPKENIIKFLTDMPCALEQADVIDFCSLAQYYSMKTPSSFKTDWLKILFSSSETASQSDEVAVSQALCLPVSVYELVENSSMESPHPEAVKFFLVDCRPSAQYNAGHLSTAFHLDCNLMLQEPAQFQTAVQGLLRAQRHAIDINSAAAGEHLCFLGSGRNDEDMVVMMVVASFLQKGTQYVSLLTGGYRAIHEYFGDHMVDCLEDHDPGKCLVCNSNKDAVEEANNNNNNNRTKNVKGGQQASTSGQVPPAQQKSIDFFGKISAAMKTKSAEVKGKLIDYIVNPAQGPNGTASSAAGNLNEKHVSSTDKNQKKYRNLAPVFSIDEDNEDMASVLEHDDDDQLDAGQRDEVVSINAYLNSTDVKAHYKCQEVHMNGCMYDSYLLITDQQIVVLRESGKKDQARVIVRRPLSSIVKITAKKRHRDLITFKYGVPDGDTLLITDMDRFLIPNASEATQVISKSILNSIKSN